VTGREGTQETERGEGRGERRRKDEKGVEWRWGWQGGDTCDMPKWAS
jgi:hypothetical protein